VKYYGVYIHRNTEPGYRLRYTALCFGKPLAADTIDGMKSLIRENITHRPLRRRSS
jgi:hypothetical protein